MENKIKQSYLFIALAVLLTIFESAYTFNIGILVISPVQIAVYVFMILACVTLLKRNKEKSRLALILICVSIALGIASMFIPTPTIDISEQDLTNIMNNLTTGVQDNAYFDSIKLLVYSYDKILTSLIITVILQTLGAILIPISAYILVGIELQEPGYTPLMTDTFTRLKKSVIYQTIMTILSIVLLFIVDLILIDMSQGEIPMGLSMFMLVLVFPIMVLAIMYLVQFIKFIMCMFNCKKELYNKIQRQNEQKADDFYNNDNNL